MSLKAKIEAVIYASEEPVTLAQLIGLLGHEAQAELDHLESAQHSLSLDEAEQHLETEAEHAAALDRALHLAAAEEAAHLKAIQQHAAAVPAACLRYSLRVIIGQPPYLAPQPSMAILRMVGMLRVRPRNYEP